jgi:alanyl-tRNA synthetase
MSLLGTLVVRIAAELGRYKADLGEAATAADQSAQKMEKASDRVSSSARKDFDEAAKASGRNAAAQKNAADLVEQSAQKQVSAISALKTAVSSLGLTYAAYKVADQIRDMAMLNARYEQLGVVMTVVGKNAGYNAQEMAMYAAKVQAMGITMLESRKFTVGLSGQELFQFVAASTPARAVPPGTVP